MLKILKIKPAELKIIFWIFLAIFFITTVPYAYGYLKTPHNYHYLGIHLAPADIFVYESYINQVKDGNFLIENLYNNELPPEKNLNIFWLATGYLAKIFNLSPFFALYAAKIILTPLLLLIIYFLISFFLIDTQKRKIAMLLAVFSSGLGGLASPFLQKLSYTDNSIGYYHWPMDLWVSESNTFLTIYQSPHFIASLSFLLAVFLFFLLAFKHNKLSYSFIAGLLALIYFNFHPFYLINIFSTAGIFLIIILIKDGKRKFLIGLKNLFIIFLISLPFIIYHAVKIIGDDITREKATQNLCKTTSLPLTLISFGLPLLIALYAIYYFIKTKKFSDENIFLTTWLFVNFILIYLPFIVFQRRLVEGAQIPIVILAASGLFILWEKAKTKNNLLFRNKYLGYLFLAFIFSILISSNLYVTVENFFLTREKAPYIKSDNVLAMKWLKNNIIEEETVIAHPVNGNIIPAIAARKVYAGHWVETTDYKNKVNNLLWLFKNNGDDRQKKEFLKNSRIDYIFFSSMEDGLGDFNPEEKDYLRPVYKNGTVIVYKINLP